MSEKPAGYPYKCRLRKAPEWRLLLRPPVDENPRLLGAETKGLILVALALCASSTGFSSTSYFPGLPAVTVDLHATSLLTTLSAALYVLFMGIAPVIWAAVSDHYQVRRVLLVSSMIIFAVCSPGCGLINNIGGLIALQIIQSMGASCGQAVGAGVIADCYQVEKRGAAFAKYFTGMFLGPLLGPILGRFLIMSALSWRATFWFCFAFGVAVFLFLFIAYPETYRLDEKFDGCQQEDATAVSTSAPCGSTTFGGSASSNSTVAGEEASSSPKRIINPIEPFLLLRYSFIAMASFVSGIAFSAMFVIEAILPDLFEKTYGFSAWQTDLGAGIGNIVGAYLHGYLSDQLLLRAREKRGGRHRVEDRLSWNLWPSGFILIPFGLLLFGWSVEYRLSYWAAIIAFGIQCMGMNQVMTATSAYLVDSLPDQGASATAAGNLSRMVFSCALSVAANPMVASWGAGWTTVLLTGLTLFAMFVLLLLKVFGARLRRAAGFEQEAEVRVIHHEDNGQQLETA